MPGYEIIEQKNLIPHKDNGIEPNQIRIGFLDFLRDIKNDAEGIPRFSSFIVVGIDEVLYMTKPEDRFAIARAIHNVLQTAASVLEKKLIQVQIICKGTLKRGASLMLDYRGEQLPIEYIFGAAVAANVRDMLIFKTGFNLSS